jgi:S-adenosylmethionine synthetase
MFEKVNPCHPDKVADRIAGALVDVAYDISDNPKIAVEVLIGHNTCTIITECSVDIGHDVVESIVNRIAGCDYAINYIPNKQDEHLSKNQDGAIRCGDNGIFKGVPLASEEIELTEVAEKLYHLYPYDGKYIIANGQYTICQSNAETQKLKSLYPNAIVNPLGDWTGGCGVDSGATNRKLGSDMAQSVTGGGLHGKDLSKADVSVNIYAFLKAQVENQNIELHCSIGDTTIDGKSYSDIVSIAKEYIDKVGGFEKFAEWGLLNPTCI